MILRSSTNAIIMSQISGTSHAGHDVNSNVPCDYRDQASKTVSCGSEKQPQECRSNKPAAALIKMGDSEQDGR